MPKPRKISSPAVEFSSKLSKAIEPVSPKCTMAPASSSTPEPTCTIR